METPGTWEEISEAIELHHHKMENNNDVFRAEIMESMQQIRDLEMKAEFKKLNDRLDAIERRLPSEEDKEN